jgi:prepilin-type processing-associated H-X9-DG protein
VAKPRGGRELGRVERRGRGLLPDRLEGSEEPRRSHDGTSSTFLVGEDLPAANHWFAWVYANSAADTCAIPPNVRDPADADYSWRWEYALSFRSRHAGGVQFALADGAVRFVPDATDLGVYRALATIRGGEPVSLP